MVMVLIKLPRWCVKGEKFLISSLKKNQQKKNKKNPPKTSPYSFR